MAEEYDCVECGRHIVALPYDISKMHLCTVCLMIPGWYNDPDMAKRIDPNHDRNVRDFNG